MKIRYLCAMRVGESRDGKLTDEGKVISWNCAADIGDWVDNNDVLVLCPPGHPMEETGLAVLGAALRWDEQDTRLIICPDWPGMTEAFSPKKLALIHERVKANPRHIVVAVLPESFATEYALHFMLTEKVGQPNPEVLMVLEPGEICLIDCTRGSRRLLSAPGNSAVERMLRG
jgi:hypothetical protein